MGAAACADPLQGGVPRDPRRRVEAVRSANAVTRPLKDRSRSPNAGAGGGAPLEVSSAPMPSRGSEQVIDREHTRSATSGYPRCGQLSRTIRAWTANCQARVQSNGSGFNREIVAVPRYLFQRAGLAGCRSSLCPAAFRSLMDWDRCRKVNGFPQPGVGRFQRGASRSVLEARVRALAGPQASSRRGG
jgi:hypothetical protein